MKKFAILLITLMFVCILTACDNKSETYIEKEGPYDYKMAYGVDATLSLLNNFDDEKYDIVAITQQGGWYTIFYKETDSK